MRTKLPGFILMSVLALLTLMSFLIVSVSVNTAAVTKEVIYLQKRPARDQWIQSAINVGVAKILARNLEQPTLEGQFEFRINSDTTGPVLLGTFQNEANFVDLNRAPLPLLQTIVRLSGVTGAAGDEIAGRIHDWRDEDTLRILDNAPETGIGTLNNGSAPNRSMQTALELGQIRGIDEALAKRLMQYATVNSGIEKLHVDAAPLSLIATVPGVNPNTITLLRGIEEGARDQRLQIIQNDEILKSILGIEESVAWRLNFTITPPGLSPEPISVAINLTNEIARAYNVIEYVGPLETID